VPPAASDGDGAFRCHGEFPAAFGHRRVVPVTYGDQVGHEGRFVVFAADDVVAVGELDGHPTAREPAALVALPRRGTYLCWGVGRRGRDPDDVAVVLDHQLQVQAGGGSLRVRRPARRWSVSVGRCMTPAGSALDTAQAAVVELTSQVQQRGSAERSAGLPLEYLLALETRLTGADRRMVASAAETLRGVPHLARAFQDGRVGWAEVRAIVCEVRSLPADARGVIDDGFADQCNIRVRDADRLLDEVPARAASLRPDKENRNTARHIERRSLRLQPQLGGSGGQGGLEGAELASFGPVPARRRPPPAGRAPDTAHEQDHAHRLKERQGARRWLVAMPGRATVRVQFEACSSAGKTCDVCGYRD
jgi:hypothetical protein